MRTETERKTIVAYPEGRISSANAGELQRELLEIKRAHPEREIVIDAGGLEYISSAGLRVLLQLTKEQNNALTVRNVSSEVYEILEMTGFTSILNVKKKLREFSVDGSVFELLKASNYNDLLREAPERKEEIVRDYAHFLRRVHAVEMEPGELPDARDVFLGYLNALQGCLTRDLFERLKQLRIEHTLSHLYELVWKVDSLTIGA